MLTVSGEIFRVGYSTNLECDDPACVTTTFDGCSVRRMKRMEMGQDVRAALRPRQKCGSVSETKRRRYHICEGEYYLVPSPVIQIVEPPLQGAQVECTTLIVRISLSVLSVKSPFHLYHNRAARCTAPAIFHCDCNSNKSVLNDCLKAATNVFVKLVNSFSTRRLLVGDR